MSAAIESISEEGVANALEQAFGGEEPIQDPEQVPRNQLEQPLDTEAAPEGESELVEAEAEGEPEPVAEPEFEIEIDGQPEVIQGAEKIKEVLQRGIKAQRSHEENARVRESLAVAVKQHEAAVQIQTALMGDIAEIRSLDAQLEQWNKVDWAAAFDADPFNAMKLKEQRDQLREYRNAKYQETQSKHAQLTEAVKTTTAERARVEQAALLAKIPEWRNAEKAAPEKQAIVRDLADHYGFTSEEIGSLVDHRMLLVARDAMKYRELQRNKTQAVKQVRTAPPVVKPGTVAKPKTEFTKVRAHIRTLGQKGNHKAQEALVTEMLTKAFK